MYTPIAYEKVSKSSQTMEKQHGIALSLLKVERNLKKSVEIFKSAMASGKNYSTSTRNDDNGDQSEIYVHCLWHVLHAKIIKSWNERSNQFSTFFSA